VNIGLATALFIVFLVLKLTDNIDWSWLWVSSPLWIGVSLVVFFHTILIWISVKTKNNIFK
jgi:hypothetical protein